PERLPPHSRLQTGGQKGKARPRAADDLRACPQPETAAAAQGLQVRLVRRAQLLRVLPSPGRLSANESLAAINSHVFGVCLVSKTGGHHADIAGLART